MGEKFNEGAPKLPEFKLIGKIDVSSYAADRLKAIKPEKYNESLDKFLAQMAAETNATYGDLLNPDASINMDSPAYAFPNKEADYEFAAGCETFFAYKTGKTLAEWKEQRLKAPGVITEKAITALLYKVLKEDFLIVRTTPYDDYKNGVDNLIIDKTTGSVVCGFDEFKNVEEKRREKYEKISEKISAGGAFIKYGARIKEGELKRKPLRNLPAFLLALDANELRTVLPDISRDGLSSKELEIFANLIKSLEHQLNTLYRSRKLKAANLPAEQENLEKEKEALREQYGAEEWYKTPVGREWGKKMSQVNLTANAETFSKSLIKIKNILTNLKS